MSTSYVSMTGRKMQLWCRKLNFPPFSVPKTDPLAENGADISANVEYIYSRFLIPLGLSMFYVDTIRFHDWEEDAIMVSKLQVPSMSGTKNRSSCWKWRWCFHQCWKYITPIFDFNRPIYVLCRHYTFPWLGERCKYGVENLFYHHNRYQKQILLLNMALIFPPMLNLDLFPIFGFNRPIYVLCRHHTFPWLKERCKYGVQNLSSYHVRYQKQILLLKMALNFPPILNIYIPEFWFQ